MKFTDPVQSAVGLYAVDWEHHFVAWLAWREWLHSALAVWFFPQTRTVPLAWPPLSAESALSVTAFIRENRESVIKEGGRHLGFLPKPPEIVLPWRPWSLPMREDLQTWESLRRDEDGPRFDRSSALPFDGHAALRALQIRVPADKHPHPIRAEFRYEKTG